ncbi:NlpC/P60 family protein [Tateyamaria sp. ANG-S1]|uniref:NlpC/P60 family protein n=1 Tax=Tateyamaria sp. ANG-S1 TaxID=1577905 RepID=UPI00057F57FC|nr:NlpC/P60 family protein [Tateyamaria sp. ANG-S1]KIC49099.1 peptidase [Tateyamaria sp. ANG-S1]
MRVDAFRIVEEARSWIGTPYIHQMAARGAGTDCLGLVRGVWRSVIGREPEAPPAYSMDWAEPQGQELLWDAALRHLVPKDVGHMALGDVILFRMRDGSVAKHLGIQSQAGDAPRFVHAYSGHGVVESALSAPWARRVVARFQFPDVEAG